MTYYRILVAQPQKDGSAADEWQNVAIADGEPVPEGAVPLPDDVAPANGEGVPYTIVDGAAVVDLDTLKRRKCEEVSLYLDGQFLGGFTPESGPIAGHNLQTRDVTDRTNWLTSSTAYSAAIQQGAGDVAGAAFRTTANETITCTYAEGLQTLLDMAAWGKALMGKNWTLKDAIAALTDPADVQAFDVAARWDALA